jgi:hypothetical protein
VLKEPPLQAPFHNVFERFSTVGAKTDGRSRRAGVWRARETVECRKIVE